MTSQQDRCTAAETEQAGPLPSETSQELLQIMVDNIADYSILTLDPEGRVTTWTPTAERISGYAAEEIVGKHFSTFYTKEDVESGVCRRALEVACEQGRFEYEGWRMRKDGGRYWGSVIITPLHDERGKLRGFGSIARDLSERKQAEERLRQQARDILEMATVPVVSVWEGILLVPLIGMLDSARTQHLMERLLQRLTETTSQVALLDITGVPTIDTQTAQHLIETIKAVRYIGAEVVLTGVRPAIAQTLVHLGVDLSGVRTRASLSGGLRVALNVLNLQVEAIHRNAQQGTDEYR